MKKSLKYVAIAILIGFGLLTLFLSTSVIFDLFGIRATEGNYVLFVVWSNFISSIIYFIAAYGWVKNEKWTLSLLGLSTVILIIAFVWLKIHINGGGLYETKTVGALIFRISATLLLAIVSYFLITPKKEVYNNLT